MDSHPSEKDRAWWTWTRPTLATLRPRRLPALEVGSRSRSWLWGGAEDKKSDGAGGEQDDGAERQAEVN
eukprot:3776386-Pyramimonas_sp.AAC.1